MWIQRSECVDQKPLDHVSGKLRPGTMSFGDLKLLGHFDIWAEV